MLCSLGLSSVKCRGRVLVNSFKASKDTVYLTYFPSVFCYIYCNSISIRNIYSVGKKCSLLTKAKLEFKLHHISFLSPRFEEQLHQWLAEDTGQLTDSLSLPFYLPQTLVATPQIIHPLIKTSTPCIPQVKNEHLKCLIAGSVESFSSVSCAKNE